MQVPFLRRQTLSTQQRRSLHSCSPGFQDCKNPEMFRQVFFSMFLGSSASLQEPWNVSSSSLLDVSRFICFIIVTCLEIKLAWKHTWIWVTPCKKSSNSIIIESMLPIWDLFYMLGIQVSLCLQNRLCPIQIGQKCAYLVLCHYLMCTMCTYSSKYLVHCTVQKVPIKIL